MNAPRFWQAMLIGAAILAGDASIFAQPAARPSPSPPPLPYFQWKVCPFEGCTYSQWRAIEPVPLYSTWKKSRTQVGALEAGERVVAVTGVVITYKPGVIRIDRDFASWSADVGDFKRGDRILTYAYRGEGRTTAWYKGRLYDAFDGPTTDGARCPYDPHDCLATLVDKGQTEWWAQVRLRSGRSAWVWMDHAHFDGVDALG